MTENSNKKEPKRKFALWIRDSVLNLARENHKKDNCSCQSEYIEKAIIFYTGYLNSEDNRKYLPNTIASTMRGISDKSDNRISRMLFKIAVEQAIMMNLFASQYEIDDVTLARLRGSCVEQVKKTNGSFSIEDAVRWQNNK